MPGVLSERAVALPSHWQPHGGRARLGRCQAVTVTVARVAQPWPRQATTRRSGTAADTACRALARAGRGPRAATAARGRVTAGDPRT